MAGSTTNLGLGLNKLGFNPRWRLTVRLGSLISMLIKSSEMPHIYSQICAVFSSIKHAHDGYVVRRDYKLVQFQLQQLYGEIVQLQSALNDDYNNVQEKSNMYHISEPIIRRFFPKRVLLCSLLSSFH